jgi:hypothetical protein
MVHLLPPQTYGLVVMDFVSTRETKQKQAI